MSGIKTITPNRKTCSPKDRMVVQPRLVLILPADSTRLSSNMAILPALDLKTYRHRESRFCSQCPAASGSLVGELGPAGLGLVRPNLCFGTNFVATRFGGS